MIIGLTGYAGSGKDTVARALKLRHGFERVAFADKLKELAYALNPTLVEYDVTTRTDEIYYVADIVDYHGWDVAKKYPEIREYLQNLGEQARQVLGDDVWVRAANLTVEGFMTVGKRDIVITDVRYPNEAAYIRQRGGAVVRIERPGLERVNDHVTETNVDSMLIDAKIVNEGSITELGKKATDLVKSLGG